MKFTNNASMALSTLHDRYSLEEIRESLEHLLTQHNYEYTKEGDSEYVLNAERGSIKRLVFKELMIPKIVLEAVLSFTQVKDRLHIRVTVKE